MNRFKAELSEAVDNRSNVVVSITIALIILALATALILYSIKKIQLES